MAGSGEMDWSQFDPVSSAAPTASGAGAGGADWSGFEAIPETLNPPSGQEVSAAPPQDTSAWRIPRGIFQAAETGLGRAAGIPGDLQSLLYSGINLLDPEAHPDLKYPTSSEMVEYLGRHGIGHTADLVPQGSLEKTLFGGTQGLFEGGPFGPLPAAASAAGGGVEGLTGSPAAGAAVGALAGGAGTVASLRSALPRLASSLGTSSTLEDAGNAIRNSQNWLMLPQAWTKGSPEGMANKLLNSGKLGGTDLRFLRAYFPDEADELAAAMLRQHPERWGGLTSEAQAALISDPAQRSLVGMLSTPSRAHSLHSLVGGGLGAAMGAILGHLIPETSAINPIITAAAGEMAGMATPYLTRPLGMLLRNPRLALPALEGAGLGGNVRLPSQ